MSLERHPCEKRMPWWADMAVHPDAPYIEFYGTGRCQNPTDVVCPYCGEEQSNAWELFGGEENADVDCSSCEREFRAEASFGFGYSTYPKECRATEHRYVFVAQYQHEGKLVRYMKCTQCEDALYCFDPPSGLMLPWRDEYDDPSTFDPDGLLVSTVPPRETPVLDALRARRWRNAWCPNEMARALEKHDKVYGGAHVLS